LGRSAERNILKSTYLPAAGKPLEEKMQVIQEKKN
jgi:hypothetical protein